MADVTDIGSQVTEEATAAAINAVRLRAQSGLPFKGECYNCEAHLSVHNFCDKECRDEYEEFNRKQQIGRS